MKNELKAMFTEYWKYLAVNAACELYLFDKIYDGQNKLEILTNIYKWDSKTLLNLLDFLTANCYLIKLEDRSYKLTDKGNLLREQNLNGLYYACIHWSGEHLTAWQNLKYTIETGKSSFEEIYKKPYFEYLNDSPVKLHAYHNAMYEYARDDYKTLHELIDFSKHNSVMDVGGGYSAILENIKKCYINVECILFDLEKVVTQVAIPNIKKVGGSFFENIPSLSEAIILSRVLHDWNNEKAKIILNNCYNALPDGGILYVIENLAERVNNIFLLSLSMSAICESYERTKSEYEKLLKESNFIIISVVQLNELQYILIAKK